MKKILLFLSITLSVLEASDYTRANSAAQEALQSLDCEFEDCKKEAPKPQVVVKEKVVVKEVVVEKPVYVQMPAAPQPKAAPTVEVQSKKVEAPSSKQPQKEVGIGIVYNKAYFDMYPRSQAPILDYITFSKRTSFDIKQFVDSVSKIKENGLNVDIYGRLEVPDSITTSRVYVYSGEKYYFRSCCGYKEKKIFYNDMKKRQNSDFFLVDVLEDDQGHRYVKYKIKIHLESPWQITAGERDAAPNTFFFKMAPKVRGFKRKFIPVKVYLVEE
ncbi:MAG: hypothetical protein GXO11_08255 [Epsilonproteobacteria bacterium]|nr:hypothetical protein [Campylobacterota bacterium]